MRFAQDRLYHILYRTVCVPTHEFYYGIHSTDDLKDGYIGTGKKLKCKIRKYGKNAFVCSIVSSYTSREEAALGEAQYVTAELLKHPLCLNLQTGGFVNVMFDEDTLRKLKKTPEQKSAISIRRTGRATLVTREQREEQSRRVSGAGNGMYGVARPKDWCDGQSQRQKSSLDAGTHPFQQLKASPVKHRTWYHNPISGERMMIAGEPPRGFMPGRGKLGPYRAK